MRITCFLQTAVFSKILSRTNSLIITEHFDLMHCCVSFSQQTESSSSSTPTASQVGVLPITFNFVLALCLPASYFPSSFVSRYFFSCSGGRC